VKSVGKKKKSVSAEKVKGRSGNPRGRLVPGSEGESMGTITQNNTGMRWLRRGGELTKRTDDRATRNKREARGARG